MFSFRGKNRVGAHVISGLGLFLAACSPSADQRNASETAAAVDTSRTAARDRRPTTDPQNVIRRQVKAIGCQTTQCEVTVAIEIIGQTYDMGPTNSPKVVRIVANIRNEGNFTTARYALKPESRAHYQLKLSGNTFSRGKWEIDEIMKGSGNVTLGYQKGDIKVCMKEYPHDKTEIDFKSCPHPLPGATAARQMSLFGSGFEWASSIFRAAVQLDTVRVLDDPLWITCNSGCCSL